MGFDYNPETLEHLRPTVPPGEWLKYAMVNFARLGLGSSARADENRTKNGRFRKRMGSRNLDLFLTNVSLKGIAPRTVQTQHERVAYPSVEDQL